MSCRSVSWHPPSWRPRANMPSEQASTRLRRWQWREPQQPGRLTTWQQHDHHQRAPPLPPPPPPPPPPLPPPPLPPPPLLLLLDVLKWEAGLPQCAKSHPVSLASVSSSKAPPGASGFVCEPCSSANQAEQPWSRSLQC